MVALGSSRFAFAQLHANISPESPTKSWKPTYLDHTSESQAATCAAHEVAKKVEFAGIQRPQYPGVPPPFSFETSFKTSPDPADTPSRLPSRPPPPLTSRRRAPPPLPPLRHMTKTSNAPPSQNNLMSLMNIPEPPTGLTSRKLQWQNMSDSRIVETFWGELTGDVSRSNDVNTEDCNYFHIDYRMLTSLFFECTVDTDAHRTLENSKLSTRSTLGRFKEQTNSRPSFVSVLDAKRRQNIEICLKGIGILDDITPLLRTVVDLALFRDDLHEQTALSCLNEESLQLALSLYPTKQEMELLEKASALVEGNVKLGKAETFLVRLLNITDFPQRAECCLIRFTLMDELTHFLRSLQMLHNVIVRILKSLRSGALKVILHFILRAGNYLNYGSRRRECRGFSLEFLTQLKYVRSIDNSTTFLRVLADVIQSQREVLWIDLKQCLCLDHPVSDAWLKEVTLVLSGMTRKLDLIHSQIDKMQQDVVFCSVFSRFAAETGKHINTAKEELSTVQQKLVELASLSGEREKTQCAGFNVIKYFEKFYKDLCEAHDANMELNKRREQKANRLPMIKPKSNDVSMKETSTSLASDTYNSEGCRNGSRQGRRSSPCSHTRGTPIHCNQDVPLNNAQDEIEGRECAKHSEHHNDSPAKESRYPLTPPSNTTPKVPNDTKASLVVGNHRLSEAFEDQLITKELPQTDESVHKVHTVTPSITTCRVFDITDTKPADTKPTGKVPRLFLNQLLNSFGDGKQIKRSATSRDIIATSGSTLKRYTNSKEKQQPHENIAYKDPGISVRVSERLGLRKDLLSNLETHKGTLRTPSHLATKVSEVRFNIEDPHQCVSSKPPSARMSPSTTVSPSTYLSTNTSNNKMPHSRKGSHHFFLEKFYNQPNPFSTEKPDVQTGPQWCLATNHTLPHSAAFRRSVFYKNNLYKRGIECKDIDIHTTPCHNITTKAPSLLYVQHNYCGPDTHI